MKISIVSISKTLTLEMINQHGYVFSIESESELWNNEATAYFINLENKKKIAGKIINPDSNYTGKKMTYFTVTTDQYIATGYKYQLQLNGKFESNEFFSIGN